MAWVLDSTAACIWAASAPFNTMSAALHTGEWQEDIYHDFWKPVVPAVSAVWPSVLSESG